MVRLGGAVVAIVVYCVPILVVPDKTARVVQVAVGSTKDISTATAPHAHTGGSRGGEGGVALLFWFQDTVAADVVQAACSVEGAVGSAGEGSPHEALRDAGFSIEVCAVAHLGAVEEPVPADAHIAVARVERRAAGNAGEFPPREVLGEAGFSIEVCAVAHLVGLEYAVPTLGKLA